MENLVSRGMGGGVATCDELGGRGRKKVAKDVIENESHREDD